MKARTPEEWRRWHVEHGGAEDLELDDREVVLFHPEHGFVTFLTHDDVLELHHMCGDGKWWASVLIRAAKMCGAKRIRAFTKRSPKAWMRAYGGRVIGYWMEAEGDDLVVRIKDAGVPQEGSQLS